MPATQQARQRGTRQELVIDSQNFNGLGAMGAPQMGKIKEQIEGMKKNGAYAVLIQEAKLFDRHRFDYDEGHVLLTGGKKGPGGGVVRGRSGGVGILLSPAAAEAWTKSGSWVKRYGAGVQAVRMSATAPHGRTHNLFLVSSYAPDSSKTDAARRNHLLCLQACVDDCRDHETLVIGTDANARLGTRQGGGGGILGRHGVTAEDNGAKHKRIAQKVSSFLSRNRLCSAATFFEAKPTADGSDGRYYTYSSSKGRGFQLDHIFVRQRDLRKVRKAWCPGSSPVASDHRRVRIAWREDVRSHKTYQRKQRPDMAALDDQEVADVYVESVLGKLKARKAAGEDEGGVSLKTLQQLCCEALNILPDKGDMAGKATWYRDSTLLLSPLADGRDDARRQKMRLAAAGGLAYRTACNRLRTAARVYAAAKRTARKLWCAKLAKMINKDGEHDMNKSHTKDAWDIVRSLARGYCTAHERKTMQLLDPATGELCETELQSGHVFAGHLRQHHSAIRARDATEVARMRQRPMEAHMSNVPTLAECMAAVRKQRNGKATLGVPTEALKTLFRDARTRNLFVDEIKALWKSGSYPGEHPLPGQTAPPSGTAGQCVAQGHERGGCEAPTSDENGLLPAEWLTAKLTPVPKKGDLRQAKNWRSICVLDIISTVLTSVMASRIRKWADMHMPDCQNGFRRGRGTVDGLWNVTQALLQRREAGLTTWAAAVDLRAAFDSVSRDALFEIMLKLGFPCHFVNVLRRLHRSGKLEFKMGGKTHSVWNRAGVRTGDTAGPDLFLLCMMAVFERVQWPPGGAPVFVTSQYGAYDQGSYNTEFEFPISAFADDCILFFASREGLRRGLNAFAQTVKAVTGMQMHCAEKAEEESKTVAVCFPAPGRAYEDMDTTPLRIDCGGGQAGFVQFVKQTKYLGSILHYDLSSEPAMEARIVIAEAMMGAMRRALCCKDMNRRVRGRILLATVMNTLLYGSESWILSKPQLRRLTTVWNDCCIAAVGTSRATAALGGVHLEDVYKRLDVYDLEYYIGHRWKNWGGKLARMGRGRLPRMFLMARAVRNETELEADRVKAAAVATNDNSTDDVDDGEAMNSDDSSTIDGEAPDTNGGDDLQPEPSLTAGRTGNSGDKDGGIVAPRGREGEPSPTEMRQDTQTRNGGLRTALAALDDSSTDDDDDEETSSDEGSSSGEEAPSKDDDDPQSEPSLPAVPTDASGGADSNIAPSGDRDEELNTTRPWFNNLPLGGADHEWSVEYAPSRTRVGRCRQSHEEIPRGCIRFKKTLQPFTEAGRAVSFCFSLAGIIHILARKERLRQTLNAALPGLHSLRADDRRAVRHALSEQMAAETRRLLAGPAVSTPRGIPWTCERCSKTFTRSLTWAVRHQEADKCSQRRRKKEATPRKQRTKAPARGRRRRLHWLTNLNTILKRTSDISQDAFDGCRRCNTRGRQCERCYTLNWMTVAQDPAAWDSLVYRVEGAENEVGRRRRARWAKPIDVWDDPRRTDVSRPRGARTRMEQCGDAFPSLAKAIERMHGCTADDPTLPSICAAILQHDGTNMNALRRLKRANDNGTESASILLAQAEKVAAGHAGAIAFENPYSAAGVGRRRR